MKALQEFRLSQREACKAVHARRRSSRDVASTKGQRDATVALRLTQVAQAHAEHGCRRLYHDYERDAVDGDEYMNYKAFRRLYRLAGLRMGRRRRRGRAKIVRGRSLRRATRPFEGWTLDFVADRLFNGRAFRGLTMMDEFTRVDLALELNYSFPSRSVIAVLDDVAREFGYPKYVRVDNGTELTSKSCRRGLRSIASSCSSFNPASPRKTRSSNRSIHAFGPSSSMLIGSDRCSTLDAPPPTGVMPIIRPTPIAPSDT